MNFLLKIVEGPMNGAEIALVAGLRVRVGSGAEADIVLADAALPETAFELDVSADSVSLIRGEDVRALVPFEIFEIGTSAFVIGPADAPWEPLKKASKGKGDGETGDAAPSPRPKEETASPSDAVETPRPQEAETSPRAGKPRRHGLVACCCALVVLLLALAAAWFFWPRIVEAWPKAEDARVAFVDSSLSAIAKVWPGIREKTGACKASPVLPQGPSLADIARQYGLTLGKVDSGPVKCPLMKGNFARRTERMAVRALALAADPSVRLELTDDETLRSAADELLFVVTEGALKVTAAKNGVVTIIGYAPTVSSLERTIRALDADVKGVERVVTTGVTVGGTPPAVPVAGSPDAKPLVFPEAPPVKKAPRSRGTKTNPVRDYPIAGILTKPYPMVVMNNGMRLAEGAQLADVVIERIKSDRLVLRSGSTTFEWKP